MINPITDITAIVPTIYKKIAETTLTPITNRVRNSNIEITPIVIKKYFNASIIFTIYNLNNKFDTLFKRYI